MAPNIADVHAALAKVQDPEIHRPITELGMVHDLKVDGDTVSLTVLLTIAGCPMKDRIRTDVTAALTAVAGVEHVELTLGSMNDEQRNELKKLLGQTKEIPFSKPESTTQVIAVSSGKGGVGKSSLTVNLAIALAELGKTVGVLDADVYGHSVPGLLGITGAKPTGVQGMIMPVPALGLRVISMGMFKENQHDIIAWRGPILDKALTQMLADVVWDNPDFLLIDLPPGTGDIAMSIGQKLPGAKVLVITTPQQAAAEVAERAGIMSNIMQQKVLGVVENMSWLEVDCPHCDEKIKVDVFGNGGGKEAASIVSEQCGYEIPLLAQIPLEPALRQGGDEGSPLVLSDPQSPAAQAILALARTLASQKKSVVGQELGLTPTRTTC